MTGEYSIKELEQLSGIKAHTIRMWEKRYNIISPKRTDTNYRYYCDTELKKLLNIALLNNHGYKISHIAKLSPDEINVALLKVAETDSNYQTQIDSLIISMVELDRNKFEKIFSNNILKFGFEDTFLHIIYPLLVKVGVMWQTSEIDPCQEHFLSNLIRQKLIVAIDAQYNPEHKHSETFMLFLPEGELHELGLLFHTYMVKKYGFKTIYLGQSVPYDDLVRIHFRYKPEYLLTAFITPCHSEKMISYLSRLSDDCPEARIYITGSQACQCDKFLPDNVSILRTADEFKTEMEQLKLKSASA